MKEVKITQKIVIALMKGQRDLKIIDNNSFMENGIVHEIFRDVVTGREYHHFAYQVKEFLVIGYLRSLKKFIGKTFDEEGIQALYDYIQTDTFKKEFIRTYNKYYVDQSELGVELDKRDNTKDKTKEIKNIIIAKIEGQNKLALCENTLFTVNKEKEPMAYDLITGKKYRLWVDVEEYLSIGEFESLKGFIGKDLDEKMLMAIYKHIQTDSFKEEFKMTYDKFMADMRELGAILDKCDDYM